MSQRPPGFLQLCECGAPGDVELEFPADFKVNRVMNFILP